MRQELLDRRTSVRSRLGRCSMNRTTYCVENDGTIGFVLHAAAETFSLMKFAMVVQAGKGVLFFNRI